MKREEIKEILEHTSVNTINICYKVMENMQAESFDEQVQAVCDFCELLGTVKNIRSETEELKEYITKQRQSELTAMYGEYVNTLLSTTLNKAYRESMEEIEFYTILWNGIERSGVFSNVEEKAFGLYYIAIDRRIPYFQLEQGLQMENDEYQNYLRKNLEMIKKMCFITRSDFSQRTEEASLLLNAVDEIKDPKEKAAVFSVILKTIREDEEKRVINREKKHGKGTRTSVKSGETPH